MISEEFRQKLNQALRDDYNIGVCIRLQWEDVFLLLRRSSVDLYSGMYEMPGGSVDNSEDLESAAARELFEETGITIEPTALKPLAVFEFHNIETNKHKIKFAFEVNFVAKPKIILSSDHDDYVFLDKDNIERLPREGRDDRYVLWKDHYSVLIA